MPQQRVPKRRRTSSPDPHQKSSTLALHAPGPPPTNLSLTFTRVAAYSPLHLAIWTLHSPSQGLPAHLAATYVPPPSCAIRCAVLSPDAAVAALLVANEEGEVAMLLLCAVTGKTLLRVALPVRECQLVWTFNGEGERGSYLEELPVHLRELFKRNEATCKDVAVREVKEECAKYEICVVDGNTLVHYQFGRGYQRIVRVASCAHSISDVKLGYTYDMKRKEECLVTLMGDNALALYSGTARKVFFEKLPFRPLAVCAVDGEKLFLVAERMVRRKGRVICWAVGDGKWRYVHPVDGSGRVVRDALSVWVVGNGVFGFEIGAGVRKREVSDNVRRVLERGGDVKGLGGCIDSGVVMLSVEAR